MLRQLSMMLPDREKPAPLADQADEPPPAEVRETVFRACARCGQLVEASAPKCGWCGKRASGGR